MQYLANCWLLTLRDVLLLENIHVLGANTPLHQIIIDYFTIMACRIVFYTLLFEIILFYWWGNLVNFAVFLGDTLLLHFTLLFIYHQHQFLSTALLLDGYILFADYKELQNGRWVNTVKYKVGVPNKAETELNELLQHNSRFLCKII